MSSVYTRIQNYMWPISIKFYGSMQRFFSAPISQITLCTCIYSGEHVHNLHASHSVSVYFLLPQFSATGPVPTKYMQTPHRLRSLCQEDLDIKNTQCAEIKICVIFHTTSYRI